MIMAKRSTFLLTALMASILALTGCNNDGKGESKSSSKTTITSASPELEKVGYSLGYLMANGNKKDVPDLDVKAFEQGFRDGYGDDESKRALTEEEMHKVLTEYQKKREEQIIKEIAEKAKKNKEEGEKFLAENAKKEGVKTTPSGLQYKIITQGTGANPKATDIVTVHYEGKLLNGEVFDSSYKQGQPAQFKLNEVIKGWTEGLQLMPTGSKYEFYIPSELAYGEQGNPVIEPNSVLTFTVELLDEEAAKKAIAEAHAKAEAQMAEMMKQMEVEAKPTETKSKEAKPEEAKK